MSSFHLKSLYTFLHINNDSKSSLEAISNEPSPIEIGNSLSIPLKTENSTGSLKISGDIIPDDVIFEIARHASPHNVLQMCLANRATYDLLKPILYSSVDLNSTESCRASLKLFSQRPDITVWIQELILRPSHGSGWAKSSETKIDEDWVSSVVEEIISNGHLRGLTSFLWDGMESPRDSLWTALRLGCPHLRTLGSSVGPRTQIVNPDSDIFNFKDLKGFSLFTQRLQRWTSYTAQQKLPVQMWNMLLIHSPRLQSLYIDGTCHLSQLWEVRPMLTGRWDQLRSFAVGNIFPIDVPIQESITMMSNFLENHSTLENVAALGFMSFSHQSLISLSKFPQWHSYRGKLLQLKNVPIECSLRKVVLMDWFSPTVKLNDIPILASITSLSICVNFLDNSKEQSNFFYRLLSTCWNLQHLDVSCTSSVLLTNFLGSLYLAPQLRSFVLTRPRKVNEDDFTKAAMRTARTHHGLREFTFRDVNPWDHVDYLNGTFRTKNIGTYVVVRDEVSLPYVRAREAGVNAMGRRYMRSFSRNLPAGSMFPIV
ncbi:uncharacterized protein EV420DRAFT_1498457 [Desarmillaria tabescens]|uniref:F-box domain-containing protein n=1 Tax=Armillaria tabescens TaxID=1929756 RepID=A0AA39TTZ7_ARMTA|nr:uncharacterized protein EV420DRAFT_1498457 [Desarmillaria tabescens]KAK0470112.1 hypothetical protein EV420DRAFT_1498457 [Desarmillaria tabescens]